MNIVLFEPGEILTPLDLRDPRAVHVLKVLKVGIGDSFDAGIVGGPRGKAVVRDSTESLVLDWHPGTMPEPLYPIRLVVGIVRPVAARRILKAASELGVSAIEFAGTDRGEVSYRESSLWKDGEWRLHLKEGAEQAFTTLISEFRLHENLDSFLDSLSGSGPAYSSQPQTQPASQRRFAFDNYEATSAFSSCGAEGGATLAIGSERGWTDRERGLLVSHGFELVSLGERVLRTETACVASLALCIAKLGT